MTARSAPTAALLVIGNELLAGKVADENIAFAAKILFTRGVRLSKVVMCLDECAVVAQELRALAPAHDWVFTSGGIGVTHDDVTLQAVADAFDVELTQSPEFETILVQTFGHDVTERQLRMAAVPRGSRLVRAPAGSWPTVVMHNVIVLPGVPELFHKRFEAIADRLEGGRPFVSRAVYVDADEWEIADMLDEVVALFSDVQLGSYPLWGERKFRVRITFDGVEEERVEAACRSFLALLPRTVEFRDPRASF